MLLLLAALALFASVIALGTWAMVRFETSFAEPDDSALSQYVLAREQRIVAQ